MLLSKENADLFFKLHPALLQHVNQRLQIFPKVRTAKALRVSGVKNVAKVREELWKRPEFIDEFVAGNPDGFSEEECAIVASWKRAVQGEFYLFRHLTKYSVFLTKEEPTKAYGVCSLTTPLCEMFWNVPVYMKATLLPFQDMIIYDGILYPYSITFGPGFRRNLNEAYREAKRDFGIIEAM